MTEPSGLLFGDPTPPLGAQQRDTYRAETLGCEISFTGLRVFSQGLPKVGYG